MSQHICIQSHAMHCYIFWQMFGNTAQQRREEKRMRGKKLNRYVLSEHWPVLSQSGAGTRFQGLSNRHSSTVCGSVGHCWALIADNRSNSSENRSVLSNSVALTTSDALLSARSPLSLPLSVLSMLCSMLCSMQCSMLCSGTDAVLRSRPYARLCLTLPHTECKTVYCL